jgi:hypothetical protein
MALLEDATSGPVAWSAEVMDGRRVAERSPPSMELSCSLMTALPSEPPPWTRLSGVLLVLSMTGDTGQGRTHGPPSLCARVGLGLP